ncbi:HPr(Ser) kinase/phosphatase [Treponema pallidum]|uniref:HPr(Ser) kinase/phosphatase n=1 Tax=Treponema pallidum TaxID=160 RepID=UPI000160BE78|nr:HPr(Ser) kinase/phosphatase [Treponema pallidum]
MGAPLFTVLDVLKLDLKERDSLDLRCIAGHHGLANPITISDLNRPGLVLSGFFDFVAYRRIQLFGRGEHAYLLALLEQGRYGAIEKMFTFDLPCCIFSHGITPPEKFLHLAEPSSCPILVTRLTSSELSLRLMRVLSNIFAPTIALHGVLVEVYGVGILISGDSGVGKSETALELIERGHRLVADDLVEISCVNGNSLIGRGVHKSIGHHMEIRGLGIINITQLYGVGSIRERKEIQMVVQLEEWNSSKAYDRLGTQELNTTILDVSVPLIEIPVRPGRNIPIILETAAMNERLKRMGYFSAKEFNQSVLKLMEQNAAHAPYYRPDDTY